MGGWAIIGRRRAFLACVPLWCALGWSSAGWSSLAEAQAAPRRPLEALVAVVGGQTPSSTTDVLLLSDVELAAHLALARSGSAEPAPTPALLQAALEQLIGETLIRREAARLRADEPTVDEVDRQRDVLERSVGGAETLDRLLAALGATRPEIDAIARRRAAVERFLGANLEGAIEVTDADIERAYREMAHPFLDRPLEEVRESLRAWLRIARLDQDVTRWLAALRRRTSVHVLRPFVETTPAAPADGERMEPDVRPR